MSKPKRYPHYYTDEESVQCTQPGYEHRFICLGCVEEGHIQLPTRDAFDCKMVFYKDGKSMGQCCCYSGAHGLRKED